MIVVKEEAFMGGDDHHEKSAGESPARFHVLTISDTRTEKDDVSGREVEKILCAAGHQCGGRELIPNDPEGIRTAVDRAASTADLVVTIGGTGPSQKDLTVEAIRPLLAKELPGFGELFRMRSVAEIGTAGMLSGALLGVVREGGLVVALPGSEGAIRLGIGEILVKELKHLLWERRRYS